MQITTALLPRLRGRANALVLFRSASAASLALALLLGPGSSALAQDGKAPLRATKAPASALKEVRQTPASALKPANDVESGARRAQAGVLATQAEAPAPEPTLASKADAEHVNITKTFAEMGLGQHPLRLSGWQSTFVVKLPLSPRDVLRRATMTLATVNSTALIRSRSALSVRLNGRVLKQYPLDPMQAQQNHQIELPVELLKNGYNDISLDVVQHYTYDCEDPAAPELWTEVNPHVSALSLTFAGTQPELAPRLSQLGIAFDKRGWLPRPLAVVSGTEQFSAAQASSAALAVQGLALRMGFRPMDIEVYGASTGASMKPESTRFPGLSSAVVRGRDVLLIGRRAEISRYLNQEIYLQMAQGPYVGIFSAMDGESVILVVTGDTDEDVRTAARTLADPAFKFGDVPAEIIHGTWPFASPFVAEPGTASELSAFDYRTTSVRGSKISPITMTFRAPAEYGARHGDLAELRLHFSYGAGLRQDSSLLVKLNDTFAVAVPLSEPAGAEFQAYTVKMPAQSIRAGKNTLTFESVFVAHKDRCESPRDEGLILTVYEDTSLKIPHPSVRPVAPDLQRFSRSFWSVHETLNMYLTERDTSTVAAALTLAAQMAQRNEAPLETDLRYEPFDVAHMMVVGPDGRLPEYLADVLPLHRRAWSAQGSHASLSQAVQDQRVVTAFLAHDPFTLKRALQAMHDKGFWNGLEGQAAVINADAQTMTMEPAATQVSFGKLNELPIVLNNWKMFVGLAVLLAAILAISFIRLVRRHAQRRQRASDEDDERLD